MFSWLTRWFGGSSAVASSAVVSKGAASSGAQRSLEELAARANASQAEASAAIRASAKRPDAGNAALLASARSGQVAQSAARASAKTVDAKRSSLKSSTKPSSVRSSQPPYSEVLARELGEPVVLTPADEQRVSELVEGVSQYVRTHKIDPPMMPAIASRMLELLREDEVDVVALARLIEQDQATSAKLMSIANSAMFKGNSEIENVRDAIVMLGTEQVAHIAIGLATRATFESPKHQTKVAGAERWNRLFHHAMTTAFAACHVASRREHKHSEAAFMGGLFHDAGKAMALRALTEYLAEKHQPAPSATVIDAVLLLVHSEPTIALYDAWSLPRHVLLVCQSHHRPSLDATPELHTVRLVSGLDTLRAGSAVEKREVLQEIGESAAALRLSDAELRVVHTETKEYGERVQRMFG
jgi:HD-like signal output (HDOD) protein